MGLFDHRHRKLLYTTSKPSRRPVTAVKTRPSRNQTGAPLDRSWRMSTGGVSPPIDRRARCDRR